MSSPITTLTESFPISLILKGIAIVLLAFLINLIIKSTIKRIGKDNHKKRPTEEARLRQTRLNFTKTALTTIVYILMIISVLLLIPGFEKFAVSLLAGAGIVAIVIGFAAQKTLANIVAGISIAIYTPFRIGDRVQIGTEMGDIEEMNLRHTVIRTWDNRRVFIPNAILAEKDVINYSIKEEQLLWTISMGISYDADIDKAKSIMLKAANSHPSIISPELKDEKGKVEKKIPTVRLIECAESSVILRLYFWVAKPNDAWTTGYDLTETIKKEFDKNNIEIPFPYRTIVYKKDLEKKKKR